MEFKFEFAPAIFFFCPRDHLRDRSVGRATKQFANFSEPDPAAVPDSSDRALLSVGRWTLGGCKAAAPLPVCRPRRASR
jgi:hypothetical protein